jgi:N-acetylneuraminic acid mutarotase
MKRNVLFSIVLILLILVSNSTAITYELNTTEASHASENTWIEKASMPTPRGHLGVGVVNGKIYAIGGMTDGYGTHVGTNEEYNPITNSWTTKTSMPTATAAVGIAVYVSHIYVIGGLVYLNGSVILSGTNFVYDPTADSWETKTPMPNPVAYPSVNVIGDKIYVLGGASTLGRSTNFTQIYDPQTDTWTSGVPMPHAVSQASSVVINDKIFVVDGSTGLNQIFNPQNWSWTLGKPMPTAVEDAAAGATTGMLASKLIYVIGGRITNGGTTLNQIYNPENNSWSVGASMPTAQYGLAVAVINDTLFAVGGIPRFLVTPHNNQNEQYLPIGYSGPDQLSTLSTTEPSLAPMDSTAGSLIVASIVAVVMVAVLAAIVLVRSMLRDRSSSQKKQNR